MNKKFNFILLIDDDRPTNFLSELVIKKANFCEKVESYIDAEKALMFLKNNIGTDDLPDLILLDINMPRMNGWEFLEEYKDLKFLENNTPIICMITTSLNPDDKLKASKIDFLSGFFLKPFSVELIKKMEEAIYNKRLKGSKKVES